MQRRLLLYVAAVIALLVAAERASDPRLYRQFFALLEERPEPTEASNSPGLASPDHARPAPEQETSKESALPQPPSATDPAASKYSIGRTGHTPAGWPAQDAIPFQRAEDDAWSRLLESLEDGQRIALRKALQSARNETPLASEEQAVLGTLVDKLDANWKSFADAARAAVQSPEEDLNEAQRLRWTAILDALSECWSREQLPALRGLAEGRLPGPTEQDALANLQQAFDRQGVAEIRDGTLLNRSAEREIWFRLWETLRTAPLADLRRHSAGQVNVVQMLRQAKEYRARLVTVRGTARMGYHLQAPRNFLGIGGYYVLWLRPIDGDETPIATYCLELPEGFPKLLDRDLDRGTTTLEEPVEVTGYFFKIFPYDSQGGPNAAPLILARSFQWEPVAPANVLKLPSAAKTAAMIGVAALFGLGLAWFAWRQSQVTSGPKRHELPDQLPASPSEHASSDTTPTPADSSSGDHHE